MGDTNVTLAILARGWEAYQDRLSSALTPLIPEQLALRAAPPLRSIEELARHIIGVRAGWFHNILGQGDDAFGAYHEWDRPDAPTRTADELIEGFTATWQVMQSEFTIPAADRYSAPMSDHVFAKWTASHRFWPFSRIPVPINSRLDSVFLPRLKRLPNGPPSRWRIAVWRGHIRHLSTPALK